MDHGGEFLWEGSAIGSEAGPVGVVGTSPRFDKVSDHRRQRDDISSAVTGGCDQRAASGRMRDVSVAGEGLDVGVVAHPGVRWSETYCGGDLLGQDRFERITEDSNRWMLRPQRR